MTNGQVSGAHLSTPLFPYDVVGATILGQCHKLARGLVILNKALNDREELIRFTGGTLKHWDDERQPLLRAYSNYFACASVHHQGTGYPSDRSCPGQGPLRGRFSLERSKLGVLPLPGGGGIGACTAPGRTDGGVSFSMPVPWDPRPRLLISSCRRRWASGVAKRSPHVVPGPNHARGAGLPAVSRGECSPPVAGHSW